METMLMNNEFIKVTISRHEGSFLLLPLYLCIYSNNFAKKSETFSS